MQVSVDRQLQLLIPWAVGQGLHQLPHGGGIEVAVGGFQSVAASDSVDGEATHRVAVASLGAL